MAANALLRVYGQGEVPVENIRGFLGDLERAYNALFLLDTILPDEEGQARRIFTFGPRLFAWQIPFWMPTEEQISSFVPASERLTLKSVRLQSPGFWEFLGALNMLETTRKGINDYHEYRKDIDYRNNLERETLELENEDRRVRTERMRLENEFLKEELVARKIENAKQLGATDRDLAPILNGLYLKPMMQLGRYEDRGIISVAEIRPFDESA
jgi:hypothetical protein